MARYLKLPFAIVAAAAGVTLATGSGITYPYPLNVPETAGAGISKIVGYAPKLLVYQDGAGVTRSIGDASFDPSYFAGQGATKQVGNAVATSVAAGITKQIGYAPLILPTQIGSGVTRSTGDGSTETPYFLAQGVTRQTGYATVTAVGSGVTRALGDAPLLLEPATGEGITQAIGSGDYDTLIFGGQGITWAIGNGITVISGEGITKQIGDADFVVSVIQRSSLKRHLFANSGITVNTSNRVTQWSDKAPLTTSISSSSNPPLFVSNGINGKPTVRFTSLANILAGGRMDSLVTAQAFTIFIVFQPSSITANSSTGYVNHGMLLDNGAYMGLFLKSPATLQGQNWDGNEDLAERTLPGGATAAAIATYWRGNGNINLQVNDGTIATTASGNTSNLTGTFQLGYGYTGTGYLGDISAVLIYNEELGSNDRIAIRNELNAEYAIF